MTFDLATVIALVTAALFIGGQLAILGQVVKSNRDQGRRLGLLEKWQEKVVGIAEYKATRSLSRAHGVPVFPDDETPT